MSYLKRDIYSPGLFHQHTLEHMNLKGHHSVVFTNGSKDADGVGLAAVFSGVAIWLSLPSYASVFTAELQAIASTNTIISQDRPPHSVIYSYSRSAIAVIVSYMSYNHLVAMIQSVCPPLD